MANQQLLSSATSPHATLPDSFIFPPDQRPPASTTAAVALPIIDLSLPRDEVRRAVLDAGKVFGFFQVINHGVPNQAIRDMETSCEECFLLPTSDKSAYYSDDTTKPNRLFSSTVYGAGGERYWRDCLRLTIPFPDSAASSNSWPDKPATLRPAVQAFVEAARKLGMDLLRLLCEGFGLPKDYFEGELAGGDVVVNVNHYPPCPQPERTLGLPPHCDRNLITLLLPGSVPGLEVAYRGDWIRVRHVPGAFVVNFGHQLEIATNGLLKSVEFMRVYKTVGARRVAVEKAFKI